jgi:predicted dehydrogenase
VTLDDGDRTIECEEAEEIGLRAENDEFIDALLHGRQPGATLTDGVRATMVMLAAIRSLDSGRGEHL